MTRIVLAVAAIALAVTAVAAQSDPIAARKALMKKNGDEAKVGAAMAKGEAPFDLTKAQAIVATFAESAMKAPALFPEPSKTGGETAALPAIWENKADFDARLVKFASDAKAASPKVTDLDTFKAQMTEVRKNGGGCHQPYRKRAS